ncbi:pyrroline-5-carboxylate reductase [Sphingobium algorifonticola]|uniref:Pyrroline-5-carboxylate reductase n=1 Tax=Sphingobium algorifonticola TaxID=2008318 RepID=A0A437J5M3_9SPHN|nr:pyrroline-5-carboxylate reductase [Sphingobium algorifonticola]RVT40249.1 pyrroline-5-carboxylate reductase [Sphingobium algorifonticola]
MTSRWPEHLFLVGCGNMAGAMLQRWISCGLDPARITVLRPSGRPAADGVAVVKTMPAHLPVGTTVMLGLKPQQLADVAPALSPVLNHQTPLLSILAGTTIAQLRALFPGAADVVRIMPNTPVRTGQGVCALYADSQTSPDTLAKVADMLAPLGLVEPIADETQFNLVTALSGCGPAYLFRFIDALATAGKALGLEAAQADRLALATVSGAAVLAVEAQESAAVLADRVASPGGMTRKGMDVLDRPNGLAQLMTETIRAARDRGAEMAALK